MMRLNKEKPRGSYISLYEFTMVYAYVLVPMLKAYAKLCAIPAESSRLVAVQTPSLDG
jgi:hypothetical protein